MLGESLYRPTARDLETTGAAPSRLLFYAVQSAIAASLSVVSGVVPGDEIWIVTHADLRFTPGAAQTLTVGALLARDTSGNVIGRICDVAPPQASVVAAAVSGAWGRVGEVMLFPGDALEAAAAFSAGANSNGMIVTAWGVRLPRGNVLK